MNSHQREKHFLHSTYVLLGTYLRFHPTKVGFFYKLSQILCSRKSPHGVIFGVKIQKKKCHFPENSDSILNRWNNFVSARIHKS